MYELCPEPYYSNCRFSFVGCSSCKASNPSSDLPLKYKPISMMFPNLDRKHHPCKAYMDKEEKDKKKELKSERIDDIKKGRASRNVGAKNERKVASNLSAEFTEASGAKYGDGDLIINAGPLTFYMECKYRGNGVSESGPTKKEWQKATSRGIESFCTSSPTYPNGVVTLTFNLFNELLELIREAHTDDNQ